MKHDRARKEHVAGLPTHRPFTTQGDKSATLKEAAIIFEAEDVTVEEKADGANTGMLLFEGNPSNRNHLLNKAFIQRKTAAKMQFASIHNWFYSNMDKFEAVNEKLGLHPRSNRGNL